jgi:hypothetical protein
MQQLDLHILALGYDVYFEDRLDLASGELAHDTNRKYEQRLLEYP